MSIISTIYDFRKYQDIYKDEELLLAARLPMLLSAYREAIPDGTNDPALDCVLSLCSQAFDLLQQDVCLRLPDVAPMLKAIDSLTTDYPYLIHEQFHKALRTIQRVYSSSVDPLTASHRLSNRERDIVSYRKQNNLYLWEEAIAVLVQRCSLHYKRQSGLEPYYDRNASFVIALEQVHKTAQLELFEKIDYDESSCIEFVAYVSSAESLNVRPEDEEPLPHYPVLYRLDVNCCTLAEDDNREWPVCQLSQTSPVEVTFRVGPRYATRSGDTMLWEPLDLLTERVVVAEVKPQQSAAAGNAGDGRNQGGTKLIINNPYAVMKSEPPPNDSSGWLVKVQAVLMTELGPLHTPQQGFVIQLA